MPFFDPDQLERKGIGGQQAEPTPPPAPTLSEMWDAALSDTSVFSAAASAANAFERGQNPAVQGYDPFSDIAGYEQYADSFVQSDSPGETAAIKKKIDAERSMMDTMSRSGLPGIAVGLAAQLTDPLNFIPAIGVAGRAIRGGEVVAGLVEGATAGLLSSAAQETVLQSTQETRTAADTAVNVAAATILGGLLGGGAATLSNRELMRAGQDLIPKGNGDPIEPGFLTLSKKDLEADVNASVGAARADLPVAGERLKSALGAEKVLKNTSPMLRMATSGSMESRKAVQELVDTPFRYEKNALGVASPVSVETMIRMWQAPLADSIQEMDRLFVKYRTGQDGGRLSRLRTQVGDVFRKDVQQGPLTYKEFKEEVGKAMRRGDTNAIPEIRQAAEYYREKLFDPLKEKAIANGLLPEDVQVDTAMSYLTRVWNIEKINARRPELVDRTMTWLRPLEPDLSEAELEDVAQQIIDKLLGTPGGRIPYAPVPLKNAGPLKERTFNIPDEMVEDFLESDIETVSRFYTRTMAPDVELADRFGRADMAEEIQKIKDDYAAKQMKVDKSLSEQEQEKARRRLSKERNADIRDLQALRDILRGTYAAPSDPNALLSRSTKVIKQWNYMRMLGGMTISAIPDLGRPVMVEGIGRVAKAGLIPMIRNLKGMRLAAAEVKKAGTALDMVLDSRAMAIADIADDFGRHSKFERGVDALARNFGSLSLMTPWNAAMKQFSGVLVSDRVLEHTAKWAKGTLKKGDIETLAFQGIDEEVAGRIAEQFAKHGKTEGGVRIANTDAWTDTEAVRRFRAAIQKATDTIIVTPGAGDKPLMASKLLGSPELASLVFQFKSFSFASMQRVALAGLQQRDAATLSGLLLSVGLGAMVYFIKSKQYNKEPSNDYRVWLSEGIDRSGVTGWLFDMNNIVEKGTRGTIGVNSLVGGPPMSRYASRNITGAVLGPTLGTMQDFAQGVGAISTGEFGDSDRRALRRLVPGQNLFYLRGVFDKVEDGGL